MIFSTKNKYFLVFLILCTTVNNYAQLKMYGAWGTATTYSQQSQKMINSKNDFSLAGMQSTIGLEYQKKRISFIGALSFFPGTTMIRFSDTAMYGYTGAKVTRFDLGFTYNILKPYKKIVIKPFVMLGLQYAKKTAILWEGYMSVYGDDYYQTISPYSEGYDMTQIVPSLGIRSGVKLSKMFEIGLNIQGVYASKTYQKIIFYYTYRSDPTERRAVFDSKGTGIFSSIYLSLDLSKIENLSTYKRKKTQY